MPPGQVADAAVAGERVDVVAHALDEVAVVADDHQRARPAVEQVLERGQRVDVEVVGRLVEQQHVRLAHQQPHQLQPAALAAGEVAHERAALLAAEAEALAQHPGGQLGAVAEPRAAADLLDRLEHAQVAGDLGRVLGEERELDRRAARRPSPGVGLQLAREQLHQRRLARAVDADEREAVARAEPPGRRRAAAPGRRRRARRARRRAPCCRAARSRSAAARRGRAARARRRSARWRPRCGTSAWTCAPAGRAAATRAPCAAAAGGAPRAPRPGARARRARARRPRSRPRTGAPSVSATSHVWVQTASRNQRSWVTTSIEPRRAARWRASQSTPSTSRWFVGSSSSSSSGWPSSVLASAIRRRSPPDSGAIGVSRPCGKRAIATPPSSPSSTLR